VEHFRGSITTNRRRFLGWLSRGALVGAVALCVGQISRFLSFQPLKKEVVIQPIGRPEDYPAGTVTYVAEVQAYVGHDAGGLYALDAVCPHLGCLVERVNEGGFSCPCHGSCFDAGGVVTAGPATVSLQYLTLSLDGEGRLMLDRSQPADQSYRLSV
jgi:cytochrome b6-f complex iron-sulfur subunit